jgi:hypothetical protein
MTGIELIVLAFCFFSDISAPLNHSAIIHALRAFAYFAGLTRLGHDLKVRNH